MIIIGHHPPDISIHALRKESDAGQRAQFATDYISIHALRKESDLDVWVTSTCLMNFNPRSP